MGITAPSNPSQRLMHLPSVTNDSTPTITGTTNLPAGSTVAPRDYRMPMGPSRPSMPFPGKWFFQRRSAEWFARRQPFRHGHGSDGAGNSASRAIVVLLM